MLSWLGWCGCTAVFVASLDRILGAESLTTPGAGVGLIPPLLPTNHGALRVRPDDATDVFDPMTLQFVRHYLFGGTCSAAPAALAPLPRRHLLRCPATVIRSAGGSCSAAPLLLQACEKDFLLFFPQIRRAKIRYFFCFFPQFRPKKTFGVFFCFFLNFGGKIFSGCIFARSARKRCLGYPFCGKIWRN